MQQEHPIRVAGGALGLERHICALFNNRDEEHRVLRSFITEGLDRGEKAIHVVGPEQRHHHVARLREGGIDVEQAIARGQRTCSRGQTRIFEEIASTRTPCWPLSRGC